MLRTLSDHPGDVLLPKVEYKRLLKAEILLNAFNATGIDNWEGYGEALAEAEPGCERIDKEFGFNRLSIVKT